MEPCNDKSNLPSSSHSSPRSNKTVDESSEESFPVPSSLIGADNYLTLTEVSLYDLNCFNVFVN